MTNTLAKYRLKSWQPITKTLFVVEEVGKQGELRVLGVDLLENSEMLSGFSQQDVTRIVDAVNNEGQE